MFSSTILASLYYVKIFFWFSISLRASSFSLDTYSENMSIVLGFQAINLYYCTYCNKHSLIWLVLLTSSTVWSRKFLLCAEKSVKKSIISPRLRSLLATSSALLIAFSSPGYLFIASVESVSMPGSKLSVSLSIWGMSFAFYSTSCTVFGASLSFALVLNWLNAVDS